MSNLQNKVSSPWDKFPVYLLLLPIHTLASHITSSLPGMPSPRSFPGVLWNKWKVSGYWSFSQKPLLVPSVCSHSSLTSRIKVISSWPNPQADPPSLWSLCTIHFSLLTHMAVVLFRVCVTPSWMCDSLMNVCLPYRLLAPGQLGLGHFPAHQDC